MADHDPGAPAEQVYLELERERAQVAELTAERDRLRAERDEVRKDALDAALAAQRLIKTVIDERNTALFDRDEERVDAEGARRMLVEEQRAHEATRADVARYRADADRSWRLLANARTATKRLTAGLIANASRLDVPYTDEPSLSPWSRFIKPRIDDLRVALGMRGAMRLPCCDLHNRNCEPPSELCCEHCTEATHPGHADGSVCIAPDLSSPPLAATCSCGTSPETYEGPEPDCTVHGAVQAYNLAQAELERQRPVIEAARAWREGPGRMLELFNELSGRLVERDLIAAVDALGAAPAGEEGDMGDG